MAHRIALIYAHPYPDRSRAGRALVGAARDLSNVVVREIYSLYPDFAIDTAAEQQALAEAETIVWQGPIFWYGVPALLKLWFEKVLAHGWAYGEGGTALAGKNLLWTVTTGGMSDAYREGASHGRAFDDFVAPVEQTARFCGMNWQTPFIVHGAHHLTFPELNELASRYRQHLADLSRTNDEPSNDG